MDKKALRKQTKSMKAMFSNAGNMDKDEIRTIIKEVQTTLETYEQVEVPIEHHFSKDVYAREMRLDAGMLIVGKIHKFENLNILSKGEVSVLSIDGYMKLKAPATFVGSPGAKRLIYAHTDVVWTTIHGTSERDVEKIEETFIAKNYDFENEFVIDITEEKKCLG